MTRYTLDTDHVIYYFNGNPEVVRMFQTHPVNQLAITRLTHAELLYGAYKSSRSTENLRKIKIFVREMNVLEFTEKSAYHYGKIKSMLSLKGKPCPSLDLLIASIALAEKSTLVTNNTRDFQHIPGLKLSNWLKK